MRILNKLFEIFGVGSAQNHGPRSGQKSLLALALKRTDVKTKSETCAICNRTFVIPDRRSSYRGEFPFDEWYLDYGGYCHQCRAFRCERHSKLVQRTSGDEPYWTAACAKCGLSYAQRPATANEMVEKMKANMSADQLKEFERIRSELLGGVNPKPEE